MARRQPITDEQRAEFIPNFRPFLTPIPIPTPGICDSPSMSLCINYEWLPIIRGLLHVLDQPDVWDTTDADELFNVRQQIKEISAMSGCLCGYGKTDLQIRNIVDITLNNQLVQIFNADGLDGVAPDRPDSTFDTDSGDTGDEIREREIALCWAVQDYVTTVVEKGIFNAFIPDAITMLTTGGIAFLVGPIGGLVYRVASEIFETVINMVANDAELIEKVSCCMLDGLQGLALTEANFATALDGCGFGALSDEAFIADAVRMGLDDTGNFLSFVSVLGSYMNVVDILDECPCDPDGCIVDFTIDDADFVAQTGANGPLATYDAGQGWDNGPSGVVNHRIHIEYTFSELIAITSAGWTITYNSQNNIQWRLILFDEFEAELLNVYTDYDENTLSQDFNFPEVTGVKRIRFTVVTTSSGLDFNGHIVEGRYTGDICDFPAQ